MCAPAASTLFSIYVRSHQCFEDHLHLYKMLFVHMKAIVLGSIPHEPSKKQLSTALFLGKIRKHMEKEK